jgi:hypothetical protein
MLILLRSELVGPWIRREAIRTMDEERASGGTMDEEGSGGAMDKKRSDKDHGRGESKWWDHG